jgi:hypothetical protein
VLLFTMSVLLSRGIARVINDMDQCVVGSKSGAYPLIYMACSCSRCCQWFVYCRRRS